MRVREIKVFDQFDRLKDDSLASARDVREDAVFDRVVLRAIRRVVSHSNLDPQSIGQTLQLCLEDVTVRRIAATAIGQNQQPRRLRVASSTVYANNSRIGFVPKSTSGNGRPAGPGR